MTKKPNKLELAAKDMIEVLSEKIDLPTIAERIAEYTLVMYPKLSIAVMIERKEDGYYSTVYLNKKDVREKNHPKFFEGIDNLVEKDGKLFYRGRYYGRIDQERSSHLKRYKGVLEIHSDLLRIRKQLEERNYLLISNRGPCAAS